MSPQPAPAAAPPPIPAGSTPASPTSSQAGRAVDIGAAAARAAENLAEDVAEDVAEARAGGAGARHPRGIHPRMAELVVGRPLLRVGQHFVGLVGLLEMLLGLRVVRIAV